MDSATFNVAVRDILCVLPDRAQDLARLRAVKLEGPLPVVTVIGKYNHGKSRLLNELIGLNVFSVADRRQTVALAEHVDEEVRWLDAPGLDADVAAADDRLTDLAAWQHADIRLFVHAAKEGELDANERMVLKHLNGDQARTRRQTLFVLTQVDQVVDAAHFDKVVSVILAQIADEAPGLALYLTSSSRYRQGLDGNKQLLIEKSGIPSLWAALADAMGQVPEARLHEATLYLSEMRASLTELLTQHTDRLHALQATQHRQREEFVQGLMDVLEKVRLDLQPVLQLDGTDHALVPDTFENMFKLTAGKIERSRIQVAYSRACIAINSHLIKHGVVGLPLSQQTTVTSLDTVMVAVMGVSVKYRNDLRRIFNEPEGRERLARDFLRYFELSDDRAALAHDISKTETRIADIVAANRALLVLEGRG